MPDALGTICLWSCAAVGYATLCRFAWRRLAALWGALTVEQTCMLCGEPLRHVPLWERIIFTPPPQHDPKGPDGDACWVLFNRRMGIDAPGPNPAKEKGRRR